LERIPQRLNIAAVSQIVKGCCPNQVKESGTKKSLIGKLYHLPIPGRARHESERVTFLIGERVRAKATAALFRNIGVISLIKYLRYGVPPSNESKKNQVGFSPCSFFEVIGRREGGKETLQPLTVK
jgi:hypothetical protein